MVARAKWLLSLLLVLLFSVSIASAQQSGQSRPAFAQEQLDQILAPIALYPDALLSQILMAATYPDEVVEAARWSRDNPDLNGDRAVRAVERIDWDPSVKSLVAFPQILDRMDEKINWTEDLGDAFLDQQAQVMDTIQYLRGQAYSAGNLSSSDQFRVDYQDSNFTISFTNQEVAYVPYYDPLIVYGTWRWPAYRPVYWAPWPGFYTRPGYARGFAWGPAIAVSRGFFFGAPDWRHRSVNVVNVNNYYYRPASRPREVARNAAVPAAPNVWQHDGAHRHDVPYRDAALRQPGARVGAVPEVRRDGRERDASFAGNRGAAGNAAAPVAITQPVMRSAPAENIPRDAQSRGRDMPAFERRGATGTPSAPAAAVAQPEIRSAQTQQNTRGRDPRGYEGRGEAARRPDPRADAGNRAAERANHPQVAGTPPAPVASQPAVRSAPVQAPQASAPARPAAPAADGGTRRADARPANGREPRVNHPAPAASDNAAAASGNTASVQDSGRNSRHQ